MYNGHGHWLTITNIGAEGHDEVLVYDSLYQSVKAYCMMRTQADCCPYLHQIRV